jgi:hypothetical protein
MDGMRLKTRWLKGVQSPAVDPEVESDFRNRPTDRLYPYRALPIALINTKRNSFARDGYLHPVNDVGVGQRKPYKQ